jgi:glutamate/tyrosine decarboxylase-like PLP-dependent enzyme
MEGDDRPVDMPMTSWFLGPKAENSELWESTIGHVFSDYLHWRRNYFPEDPVAIPRSAQRVHSEWTDIFSDTLDMALSRLKAHFPFYSPRYIAHMLSETSLPAVAGYFAGMLYNPNNVTDEAAPVTVHMEIEVGRLLAAMLGLNPERSWGHLTSGGTIATLEALWLARQTQFNAFALQAFCRERGLEEFAVKLPGGGRQPLVGIPVDQVLGLNPNTMASIPRHLAGYLVDHEGTGEQQAIEEISKALRDSEWSIGRVGLSAVLGRLSRRPRLFVSEAAHYSIQKAVNILGYGEDAIVPIPVDRRFRLDPSALASALDAVNDDEYPAAVVAIVGTTEEGAIDPVHEIAFIRHDLERRRGRSFWIHADAAWGGYFASLFRGLDVPRHPHGELDRVVVEYVEAMDVAEMIEFETSVPAREDGEGRITNLRRGRMAWDDPALIKAFLALPEADSITVDPHKLGYVPYPAGVVVFRNRDVKHHVTQRAQYIAEPSTDITGAADPHAVGPYILEGSKPGAAALATWLAHTTIPLTRDGHGKIIKTTTLSAKKLYFYLTNHHRLFWSMQDGTETDGAFTFVPLGDPDTNIVCFVAVPRRTAGRRLVPRHCSLEELNQLNQRIYAELSVPPNERGHEYPYGQPFFVSRTTFEAEQYGWAPVRDWLDRMGIGPVSEADYRKHGLFVLRSTVMNPFYYPAAQQYTTRPARDYLLEFVRYIHTVTAHVQAADKR